MTGSKKLQDIMVDAKIPQMQRDDIPVIADEQGIIWVAGMTLADRVKVVPTTNMVTKLSFTSKE